MTSAGSYGRLITRIDLEISRRTHDIIHTATDNWIVGQDVMRAPDLTALIAHYSRFAAPLRDRVIGRLAGSASRTRDESGESRMGNLVADAQLSITGADAAFIVPGGVRAGLGVGNVTYGRAFTAQPFGTTLVSVTLTGAQILDLLKEQWCGQRSPQVMGPSADRQLLLERRHRHRDHGKAVCDRREPRVRPAVARGPREREAGLSRHGQLVDGAGRRYTSPCSRPPRSAPAAPRTSRRSTNTSRHRWTAYRSIHPRSTGSLVCLDRRARRLPRSGAE